MSTFDLLRFERLQQSLFPPSLKNTACVLWIGKNYRLQDIQLSKNPVNLSVDACGHPRQPQNSRVAPARRPRSTISPKFGGEYRARTGDLLVANQALSQLS
jgi:hypothetical protein